MTGIEALKAYVLAASEGKLQGSSQAARLLDEALSAIARISSEEVEALLRDHYQDLLFIEQISRLTKTQLELSLKLQKAEV